MPKLKDQLGRVTVVLTPQLRQLAFARLYAADYGDDQDDLLAWFQSDETPDLHVLDAAHSEAEALMIALIVDALHDLHTGVASEETRTSQEITDEHVRMLCGPRN